MINNVIIYKKGKQNRKMSRNFLNMDFRKLICRDRTKYKFFKSGCLEIRYVFGRLAKNSNTS